MNTLLPASSFVKFQARRLVNSAPLWINSDASIAATLPADFYCVKSDTESPSSYDTDTAILETDMYGGFGTGFCGGSGRCGQMGRVQVKGVGLTPLHSLGPKPKSDSWHGTGALTIVEAAREVIWSEICRTALPQGAVATHAVVMTGTNCASTAPNDLRRFPRVLLFRDPAIRPAHFMRNLLFPTPIDPVSGLRLDAVRTKMAIAQLPRIFRAAFERGNTSDADFSVNEGLMCMARNFASQVAAAFAKRIFHGTLGCSNISLNGRFIDFGTMTSIEGYRRLTCGPHLPDQWNQHLPVLQTLCHFRDQVEKYFAPVKRSTVLPINEVIAAFLTTLAARKKLELLRLTGVSSNAIEKCPDRVKNTLYTQMTLVYTRGACGPFLWRRNSDMEFASRASLESLGRLDLNDLLYKLSSCNDEKSMVEMLVNSTGDRRLGESFGRAFAELLEFATSLPSTQSRDQTRNDINSRARRINSSMKFLARECLDPELEKLSDNPMSFGSVVNAFITRAGTIVTN